LIALAGVAALLISNLRPTVGIVIGASLVVLLITSAVAVALGARSTSRHRRPPWLEKILHREPELDAWVTSSFRFSVKQLAAHRMSAVVQLLATVVVAVATSAIAVTVLDSQAAAGASAIGDFASDQGFISQVGLGLVALVAGIVLAVSARRMGLGRRHEQWAAMRAMGFSPGQLRTVQLTEGLLIGVPAVAIAGVAVWLFVGKIAIEFLESCLPVAMGAAAALTVILVLTSWREKR
jgi:hypothetical protein